MEMATRRATRTVIWDSGMLVEHIVFKVILSATIRATPTAVIILFGFYQALFTDIPCDIPHKGLLLNFEISKGNNGHIEISHSACCGQYENDTFQLHVSSKWVIVGQNGVKFWTRCY